MDDHPPLKAAFPWALAYIRPIQEPRARYPESAWFFGGLRPRVLGLGDWLGRGPLRRRIVRTWFLAASATESSETLEKASGFDGSNARQMSKALGNCIVPNVLSFAQWAACSGEGSISK
jgi:hypothetical protein